MINYLSNIDLSKATIGKSLAYTPADFDLTKEDVSTLEIIETNDKNNCYIRSKSTHIQYHSFILARNSRTITLCEVQFFKSKVTGKYIPRPIFRKKNVSDGTIQTCKGEDIIVNLSKGEDAQRFWDLIGFLESFKDVVEAGTFNYRFAVIQKDFANILRQLDTPQKVKTIIDLVKNGKFSAEDIRSMVYESRKIVLKGFLMLLRNDYYGQQNVSSQDRYKSRYNLRGDEAVWQHFLKKNDWILGLNADLRFIADFIEQANVGIPNTNGKGSPEVDFLGYANYTTLIELKTPDTPIFKEKKGSNSRANTWEFSPEFISGISQCLAQKLDFDTNYNSKNIVDENNKRVSKDDVFNADVKVVFVIGSRYKEFPHDNHEDNICKSKTFELYRRNNRNVEIITYDELFERAYHIVMSEKIPNKWYADNTFTIPIK